LGVDKAITQGHAVTALASVRELSFAFRRAASRLTEMTSRSWWDKRLEKD
jgi:predicted ATPase